MNKPTIKNLLFVSIPLMLAMFIGCSGNKSNKITETTTAGDIKIAVDEAYQLLIDTEIFTFESHYKYAKVNPIYKPEGDAIRLLMQDSVRLVVTNRMLTDAEDKQLRSNQIIPRTTKICYDALAFIVNNDNPDTLLLYNQIKDIFSGKTAKWNQLNKKSTLGDLTVVFDNNLSCNTRYIREKFNLKENFPPYCFAVKSNPEVINYVEKNKNAIGIISVNWISDKDDTLSHSFLKKVHIVYVGDESNTDGKGSFYMPHPGNIAEGSYPLTREVYMITRETFTGLGTGFVQFVAGDVGQRIILKSGLVPATMPVRLVQIKGN